MVYWKPDMKRTFFVGVMSIAVLFHAAYVYAEDPCATSTVGKTEDELRANLAKCEEEIKKSQAVLNQAKTEVKTIDGEVKTLQTKISAAEKTIQKKNATIVQLGSDIRDRLKKIESLEEDIVRGKESLSELVRRTNEVDDYTLAEVFLNRKDLSDFYVDIDNYTGIKTELEAYFANVRDIQAKTEAERAALAEKQNDELDAKYDVEQQKKQVAANQAQQKKLLGVKQSEAKVYEGIVKERQKQAAAIRAELFKLRDTTAIPFSDALAYAQSAEKSTGVRAAFVLAILRQESNLGANVGQCLLVDSETGAGKGKNTGTPFAKVMSPTRDVPVFLSLMAAAGRDPYNTPVSCPQSIGWGGAMGPTQFIPSTWNMVSAAVGNALGTSATDPWNPQHAIMATAVYTQRLGAAKQTYTSEREAAARYYAGGNWATYGLGYAASVLRYAEEYQKSIDFLADN